MSTVRERKAARQRLYDLGFYEDDNDDWRCIGCRAPMQTVACDCDKCHGSCEWCAPFVDVLKAEGGPR